MSKFDFTISGADDVEKMFRELEKAHQKKALRHAFRQGANVVLKQARANARQQGLAKRIIKAMGVRIRSRGLNVVQIYFKNTAAADGKEKRKLTTPALASIAEFGSVERHQKKTGRFTGKVKATPFMRPAVDAKFRESVKIIIEFTEENIKIIQRQVERRQKVSLAKKNRTL